ncbi:MAG: DsrE family protein [Bradymonadaceae bacterium]
MQIRNRVVVVVALALFGTGLTACATANGHTTGNSNADTSTAAESESTKAAIGVRKPKHVGVALMTADQMLSGQATQSADQFTLVTCGPAIRALGTDSKFADRVREGLEAGVEIKACGVTVERMGFDKSTFIDGVEVVPNGFVELLRLQEEGFHTIEL